MRRLALAAVAAGLALSGCATSPPAKPTTGTPVVSPSEPASPPPVDAAKPAVPPPPASPSVSLATLAGWAEEDHVAGLAAFRAGCAASRDPAVRAVCDRARRLGTVDDRQARTFFENNFEAQPIGDDGVLTAYFAPEYEARDRRDATFDAPVRGKPSGLARTGASSPPVDLDELIEEALQDDRNDAPSSRIDLSKADRATIERSAPDGALAWMRAEDLFFLQIQGSGVLTFPDGRRLKAAYAGDNGKPFVAIARPMVQRGIFKPDGASGDAIRGWLAANRGARAAEVMRLNPRYIFFDLTPDDGREPAGAAGIPLPAGRAIAVDPSRHAYGDLYWIDAQAPLLAGAHKVYRRLTMALDTGSAIRGDVRADLYLGRGDVAGAEAGRVRHRLKMLRLRPIDPSRSARHEADAEARGG